MDKYKLYRQASEFTGFHKKLGVLIEPYLNERWTMADIGCGMALLDFQVMGSVRSITAIDTDGDALAEVERRIDEELAANRSDAGKIKTVRKDASELKDERWDVVLMSFFASSPEMAEQMLSLADHRGVIIMHGHERGGIFDPMRTDNKPRMTVKEMEGHLVAKGYGYRKNIVDLQFGQPFRTIDDIHEFIGEKSGKGHGADPASEGAEGGAAGDSGAAESDIERLTYSVEERIIKTKRYDYPYYLPRNLRAAIFIVGIGG
ncbi:MAG: hypothetical protein LBL54_01485 [Clostridiales Family XIII bacterium]|nr:hypothetical protein [Clostridiales Family XIII bacterium]